MRVACVVLWRIMHVRVCAAAHTGVRRAPCRRGNRTCGHCSNRGSFRGATTPPVAPRHVGRVFGAGAFGAICGAPGGDGGARVGRIAPCSASCGAAGSRRRGGSGEAGVGGLAWRARRFYVRRPMHRTHGQQLTSVPQGGFPRLLVPLASGIFRRSLQGACTRGTEVSSHRTVLLGAPPVTYPLGCLVKQHTVGPGIIVVAGPRLATDTPPTPDNYAPLLQ